MSHYTKTLVLGLMLLLVSACQPTTNESSEKESTKEEVTTESTTYETVGTIERVGPAVNDLIPDDAKIEVLASGMVWSEGPLFVPDQNWVLFSDVPQNKIYKWTEAEGLSVYLSPSGFTGDTTNRGEQGSNGLIFDSEGRLVLCQHGDRRVARMDASIEAPKSQFITLVDNIDSKRFNSPNDLVYDKNGNLYFTDPPYGLGADMMNNPKKELAYQGVFRLDQDGTLTLLTDELSRPNGITLSPDQKTLYVANSDPERAIWMSYPIQEDGTLGDGSVFYDATSMTSVDPGLPDGLKVDSNGNVFATGPGGVWIFNKEGKVLGKIKPGELVSNCAFDDTFSTLYMTADDYLMRVKLK
ncbi:MAG: SMP-30/gluconolactonase/LRE family protein [Bacteroidota bacterium]